MRKIIILLLFSVFSLFSQDFIECYYIPDPPPSIDGYLTEWYRMKGIEIKGENVVYGKDKWKGESDLSGVIWVGWRNECLFIAVDVVDDKFVQNMTGKDLWKGDHIEIDINPEYEQGKTGIFTEKQFMIGISPGNLQNTGDILLDIPPEYYIWQPMMKEDVGIKVMARKTGKGWSIEASIPWKVLKVEAKEGKIISVDIRISDTDSPDIQEKMTSLYKKSKWEGRKLERLIPLKLVEVKNERR